MHRVEENKNYKFGSPSYLRAFPDVAQYCGMLGNVVFVESLSEGEFISVGSKFSLLTDCSISAHKHSQYI